MRKAKVNDTKVVLSLPEFNRILTMRTLGSDTNVLDDLEQIKRIVQEGDGRLMVWLYWRENPNLHAASCSRYEDDDDVWEAKMPCVPCSYVHREKLKEKFPRFHNAMVSRPPVGKKEMLSNPKGVEAIRKEWSGLHKQHVVDMKNVREYDDVQSEARRLQEVVHFARVHGIMVEKNEQLPADDPRRKFKYRVVLLGNQVKDQDQDMADAIFHDLGNSPATCEASRLAALWVELPREGWAEDGSWDKFRRPCVDAGTSWEEHCHKGVTAVGFEPVGAEWPSVYVHKELNLLLVVYVDDFNMAGPKGNLKKGWELLRTKLEIEPETGLGLYLGCNQIKGTATLGGVPVNTVLIEGCKDSIASGGCEGPSSKKTVHRRKTRRVTWCKHIFNPDVPFESDAPKLVQGELAASVLMKLLYAARLARFDLLRPINSLARHVTKWSKFRWPCMQTQIVRDV